MKKNLIIRYLENHENPENYQILLDRSERNKGRNFIIKIATDNEYKLKNICKLENK